MRSVWTDTAEKPTFDHLKGDTKTDVLIVGGGLSGLLCAHRLHAAGIDYLLIEAKEIAGGVTHNTTAKVTAQHGLIYGKLLQQYGLAAAKQYYRTNARAVEQYRTLCRELDCPFEPRDAYVYSRTDPEPLRQEWEAYHAIGVSAELVTETPLPFPVAGAVKLPHQGQINPLQLLYRLARPLNIREHTKLRSLAPNRAETDRGTIRYRTAIIATHFPLLNKHGAYFLKLYQHRSYVLALAQAQTVDGMYVDADPKGLSFRNCGDLLLLGGGSHRTGKPGGGYAELEAFAGRHYPDARVCARYATQDCMSLDGVPYIGLYSRRTPHLLVATGYNKWGFTSSMAAAQILCDRIQGRTTEDSGIFSPSRSMWHPQLALNGMETVVNLLTPTAPRCPHMGCALKYNRQEHTWDCPCHGSRFTKEGQLLDNPATDDKRM